MHGSMKLCVYPLTHSEDQGIYIYIFISNFCTYLSSKSAVWGFAKNEKISTRHTPLAPTCATSPISDELCWRGANFINSCNVLWLDP